MTAPGSTQMKLFLYEFITGGGLLAESQPPSDSLLAEGRAMISALAEDFSQIDQVEVMLMADARLDLQFPSSCQVACVSDPQEEQATFSKLAVEADLAIVIAPEFDGILLQRSQAVLAAGGHLLSCSPNLVRIAADKQQTAELLKAAGVPVPVGCIIKSGEQMPHDICYPAVIKPNDGAGSQGVRLLRSIDDVPFEITDDLWRLEQYCSGLAISCAVLSGPNQRVAMPACVQNLADDGSFSYVGGSLPLDASLDQRARMLAESAVAALPDPLGYIGVDLVIGDASDGSQDVVIEINPRLTTSYVGLRKLAKQNLAQAMLDIAGGKPAELSWSSDCAEFLADGTMIDSTTVPA
jgi:predicted ATP-grasp superfamily ATP-dependent carboligase